MLDISGLSMETFNQLWSNIVHVFDEYLGVFSFRITFGYMPETH